MNLYNLIFLILIFCEINIFSGDPGDTPSPDLFGEAPVTFGDLSTSEKQKNKKESISEEEYQDIENID